MNRRSNCQHARSQRRAALRAAAAPALLGGLETSGANLPFGTAAARSAARRCLGDTPLRRRLKLQLVFGFAFACGLAAHAATLPREWQYEQQFTAPAAGLVKLSLPIETLDAARPALEDLRLYDDAGNEVPYLIERPVPASKVAQVAKSFQVSLNPGTTVITLETGLTQPLDGVTLETPANNFIKAVKVEGSADGRRWQTLGQGQPIFRQPYGASQLRLTFSPGEWRWLRLTVDDQRSQPIPFTGARVHAAAGELATSESLTVAIAERHENPGETRLTLNLGAANLDVAKIEIETPEPLFTRQVTLAVPQISEDTVREQPLATGAIYRVAVEGQPVSANLSMALEAQVRSRELFLLIQNYDSPPLPITAARAERHPVYLIFLARQSGVHHVLTGNSQCAAPRYDLASLGANLKSAAVSQFPVTALANNPSYRLPEALPGIQEGGTLLDVGAWKFRKPVKLARAGAQQLELDLDVLAHALPGFQDLRLVRDGQQMPYVLERTSISRTLTPVVTPANDPKKPKLSRWAIKLSHRALPAARLVCVSRTPLFQRDVVLYEEIADERGEKYRRVLSQATWTQTPDRRRNEFVLTWNSPVESDTLFLESDNGDNPPIELEQFRLFYPATRVLFKAKPAEEIFLYYGNPRANSPRYDLSLVSGQLLAADKALASLAAEEQLKKSSWGEKQRAGKGGVVFWGILGLVVVVLLVIISRLLPKQSSPRS